MVKSKDPLLVRLPSLGEGNPEAKITRRFKKPGEFVQRGESVVEVESDKASFEIEAPEPGVIASISSAEILQTGDPLFTLHVRPDAPAPEPLVVRMPPVSDSTEYTLGRFLKNPGDPVRRDEPIVEIEDAKVTIELTAPESGIVTAITHATTIHPHDPLYSLHVQELPPPPPAPPPPQPRPIREAERAPWLFSLQQSWDVRHLQARAQSLAGPGLTPRQLEAALFWLALVQALVAVPRLHARLVDRLRATEALLNHCELSPGELHWRHVSLGPGSTPSYILARAKPLRSPDARIEVIRLSSPTPILASPARPVALGLSVVIGPITPEPVVEAGTIVVRPRASLALSSANGLPADDLLAFSAALAEQLSTI